MENKPHNLAAAIRQVMTQTNQPVIAESTAEIVEDSPSPDKFDTSDQRSLKMVLKQFEMSDDFDEILSAVRKSNNKRLTNFLIALVVELDANPSLLKQLGKSYRGS